MTSKFVNFAERLTGSLSSGVVNGIFLVLTINLADIDYHRATVTLDESKDVGAQITGAVSLFTPTINRTVNADKLILRTNWNRHFDVRLNNDQKQFDGAHLRVETTSVWKDWLKVVHIAPAIRVDYDGPLQPSMKLPFGTVTCDVWMGTVAL